MCKPFFTLIYCISLGVLRNGGKRELEHKSKFIFSFFFKSTNLAGKIRINFSLRLIEKDTCEFSRV